MINFGFENLVNIFSDGAKLTEITIQIDDSHDSHQINIPLYLDDKFISNTRKTLLFKN